MLKYHLHVTCLGDTQLVTSGAEASSEEIDKLLDTFIANSEWGVTIIVTN